MMRKHINQTSLSKDLDKLPFYIWDCLTLQLKKSQVDIVVPSGEDMNKILTLLIYRLRTVDGSRNTAVPLLK